MTNEQSAESGYLTADEKWRLDTIVHVRPFRTDDDRLSAIVRAVEGILSARAQRIEAELICCDVFERLHDKPTKDWTDDERSEYRRHSICYWSEASRRLVLDVSTPPGVTNGE